MYHFLQYLLVNLFFLDFDKRFKRYTQNMIKCYVRIVIHFASILLCHFNCQYIKYYSR